LATHSRKQARRGARPAPKKTAKPKRPPKAKAKHKAAPKPAKRIAPHKSSGSGSKKKKPAVLPTPRQLNGAEDSEDILPPAAGTDVQTRIRELIKLAKEQGYLTFDDLNEALPPDISDADELDAILTRLRRMEIDIIEASEVDRYKDGKKESEDDEEEKPEPKLDILDDPVRMYLKQMGQVPLLTREQEVEISKRIEEAEIMVQRLINRFGFIAQAHLDLAQKLTEGGERFDRVILDKKIESRERYMKMLPRLCKQVEKLSGSICQQYSQILHGSGRRDARKAKALQKAVAGLEKLYPKLS